MDDLNTEPAEKSAAKKINPFLKSGLELGPIAAFFIGYGRIKEDTFHVFGQEYQGFIVATALFIPVLLASMAILWWLTGKLSRMQQMTAVLVIVFGGLSVWFNDERFFKMKPTILYAAFAIVLGIGLARGRSYLRVVMEEFIPMSSEGWMKLTQRMTFFFVLLAGVNEVVWRTMSTDAWVNLKTFGLPIALVVFVMSQGKLIEAHAIKEED